MKCTSDAKDVECFGHELEPVKVHFNSSGVAKTIELYTGCKGVWGLTPALDKIVPKKTRCEYLQRIEYPKGSCDWVSEEDYDCVKIKYLQKTCMGCAPASITVSWK